MFTLSSWKRSQEGLRISRRIGEIQVHGGEGQGVEYHTAEKQHKQAQGRGATWCVWGTGRLDPNGAGICREAEAGSSQYVQGEPYVILKASDCTWGINRATVTSASQKAGLGRGRSPGGGHSRRVS